MSFYARTMATDHRGRGLLPALRRAGAWLVLGLLRWQELNRQRHSLLQLDDRMLKDLGLSRADAQREGLRPFWDQGIDHTSRR
jgi:uncharacterized protein YjiS (DUF1127 family)